MAKNLFLLPVFALFLIFLIIWWIHRNRTREQQAPVNVVATNNNTWRPQRPPPPYHLQNNNIRIVENTVQPGGPYFIREQGNHTERVLQNIGNGIDVAGKKDCRTNLLIG